MRKIASLIVLLIMLTSCATVFSGCNYNKETPAPTATNAAWMANLRDEVLLNDVVMQGSFAAGSRQMTGAMSYQADTIGKQLSCGVRYFDLQLSKILDTPIFMHKFDNYSYKIEDFCKEVAEFITSNPSEFVIFNIRESRKTSFEPTLALMEQHLEISKKAVSAATNLGTLTMGQIRENGWNFLITSNYTTSKAEYSAVIVEHEYTSTITTDSLFLPSDKLVEYYDSALTNMKDVAGLKIFGGYLVNTLSTDRYSLYQLNSEMLPTLHYYLLTLQQKPETLAKLNIVLTAYSTELPELNKTIIDLNSAKGNFKTA